MALISTKFDSMDNVYTVHKSSLCIAKVIEIIINETFDRTTINYKLDIGEDRLISKNEDDIYRTPEDIVDALKQLKPIQDRDK